MREIKFRYWNFETKEMQLPGDWFLGSNTVSYDENEGALMQFTGLLDRNGKEVYEGDIIYFGGRPQIIKWSDTITGYAMWFGVGATTGIPETFEVIGNQFQHPELINS